MKEYKFQIFQFKLQIENQSRARRQSRPWQHFLVRGITPDSGAHRTPNLGRLYLGTFCQGVFEIRSQLPCLASVRQRRAAFGASQRFFRSVASPFFDRSVPSFFCINFFVFPSSVWLVIKGNDRIHLDLLFSLFWFLDSIRWLPEEWNKVHSAVSCTICHFIRFSFTLAMLSQVFFWSSFLICSRCFALLWIGTLLSGIQQWFGSEFDKFKWKSWPNLNQHTLVRQWCAKIEKGKATHRILFFDSSQGIHFLGLSRAPIVGIHHRETHQIKKPWHNIAKVKLKRIKWQMVHETAECTLFHSSGSHLMYFNYWSSWKSEKMNALTWIEKKDSVRRLTLFDFGAPLTQQGMLIQIWSGFSLEFIKFGSKSLLETRQKCSNSKESKTMTTNEESGLKKNLGQNDAQNW